jgi:hypothetical protein
MINRLNFLAKSLKNKRVLSTKPPIQDTKLNLQSIFFDKINDKNFQANQDECLVYLNSLFNSFQNFIHFKNIRNKDLINHWKRYLSTDDQTLIQNTLLELNKHENFKQLNTYLLKNLENYSPKEVAFISKTFKSINLQTENDLSIKLNDYCFNNLDKFDLYDIGNVIYNHHKNPFLRHSATHVHEKLLETATYTSFIFDVNQDKFENMMKDYDLNTKLWLKLDILKSYKHSYSIDLYKALLYNFFEESRALINKEPLVYEINCIINLCSQSYKTVSNILLDDYSISPFIQDEYLNKLFNNFDLYEYKTDLNDYLKFFTYHKKLNNQHYESLSLYLQNKVEKSENYFEFFEYSRNFSYILSRRSKDRTFRTNMHIEKKGDRQVFTISEYDSMYYYLISILSKSFASAVQTNYDKFIKNLDKLSFPGVSESLILFCCLHKNPKEVLVQFYTNFFKIYSKFDPEDKNHFRHGILKMLEFLVELKKISSSKTDELKLCSLLEFQYYTKSATERVHLISFLMLNQESLHENIGFIQKQLVENIISTNSLSKITQFIYLLDQNLNFMLRECKPELIEICSVLYEARMKELISKTEVMNNTEILKNDSIRNIVTNLYWDNKLMTVGDKNRVFSYAEKIDLKLNIEDAKNLVLNDRNIYMRLDQSLYAFVEMLKCGNFYSQNTLDQFWAFLIETFRLFINYESGKRNNFKNVINKFENILRVMSIYTHFDYTKSENYLKNNEMFEAINQVLYNNILRHKISTPLLVIYVENLISLNLFVGNAFVDLIQQVSLFIRNNVLYLSDNTEISPSYFSLMIKKLIEIIY